MSAKVYTKTGDGGKTSLLGGSKIPKNDDRIASYGNVDELNAFVGLLHDQDGVEKEIKDQLHVIQNTLFNVGSILACEPGFDAFELPKVDSEDTEQLETWIDQFDKELPELKNFILPAGHKIVSLCHVCRTVCRRAERGISAIMEDVNVQTNVLPYINRLSDYFFVLGRKLQKDLKVEEIPWKQRSSE